jgi:cobalt/nickel transport protein
MSRPSTRTVLAVGLALCVLVAAVLSAWASSHPDGLEHVAQSLGFAGSAQDSVTSGSPLADYSAPGVEDPRLSGGLAGVLGVAVVGLVMAGLLTWLRRGAPARER